MTIYAIAARFLGLARKLWSKFAPLPAPVEPLRTAADRCCRSRRELVVENDTLRHRSNVLRRRSGWPRVGLGDRRRLLLSAALLPTRREAIVIVRPLYATCGLPEEMGSLPARPFVSVVERDGMPYHFFTEAQNHSGKSGDPNGIRIV